MGIDNGPSLGLDPLADSSCSLRDVRRHRHGRVSGEGMMQWRPHSARRTVWVSGGGEVYRRGHGTAAARKSPPSGRARVISLTGMDGMAAAGPSHCNCRSLLIYLIYGSRVDYGGAYKSSSICERLRRRLQKEMRRGHRSVSLFSFSPVCLTATSLSSPPPRKQLASCFPSVTGPSPNCWAHLLLLFRFSGKSTAALSEMKVTAWRNPPQRARRRRRCVWVAGVINKSRYLSRGLAG